MINEPLYIHIIRDIQGKIVSGQYPSDTFIPSELELQDIYKVSRTTVRRAISELINAGYLTIIKGVGTKVMPSRLMTMPEELMSFTMGNCITLEDTNGNRKLLKRRYEQKIDAVAAMMDAYIAYKANKDAFE